MQPRNLAASAGRWSAQHRKAAILGWVLFVVLATVLGGRVGLNEIDESASGSGESKRGDMLVEAAGFPDQAGEQVLVQGKGSIKSADPRVTAAVKDVVNRLAAIPGITEIESPLNASDRVNTVSKDGRSVVVNFTMPGTDDHVEKLVDKPLAAVADVQKAHSGVRVEQFGDVSATKEIAAQDAKDGKQARVHLLRPDADHPAGRVRRARRRRPPARARRHRRHRHGRPAGAGQPGLRARARRRPARGDHRPRRRRGLRHVLLAPDDGGARPGPLERGRAGDRRPPRRVARCSSRA